MKKTVILTIFLFFYLSFCFCQNLKTTSDSFITKIINKSLFTLEIDDDVLQPNEEKNHCFPVYQSELYDGWNFFYKIPLTESVFYEYGDKVHIANNQKSVMISNPDLRKSITESYIIIRNSSTTSIQLSNGIETVFRVCTEGKLNGYDSEQKFDYYIIPKTNAVYDYEYSNVKKIYVKTNESQYKIINSDELKKGYIYEYEFTGTEVKLCDSRPITKICEPTWELPFIGNVVIGSLKYDSESGNTYIFGKKSDSAFIQSVDVKRSIKQFDEESSVNDISDILIKGNSLLVSCSNMESCLISKYTKDGEKLGENLIFPELKSLSNICELDNSSFIVTGIGKNDKSLFIISVKDGKKLLRQKNLFEKTFNDNIDSTLIFVDNQNEKIYAALDYDSSYSEFYKIYVNSGANEIIEFNENISKIHKIVCDDSQNIYVVAKKENQRTAIFRLNDDSLTFDSFITLDEKEIEISDAYITNGAKLVLCGCFDAVGGIRKSIPFIRCIDLNNGDILWENKFSDKSGTLQTIMPYLEYGFISLINNKDGYSICRLTSSGKTTESHQKYDMSVSIKTNANGVLYVNGKQERFVKKDEIFTFSILPQKYIFELRSEGEKLLDYAEINFAGKKTAERIELNDNSKFYDEKNISEISYRLINNEKGIEITGNGELLEQLWLSDIKVANIETILIDEGITAIGNGVFKDYKNLVFVQLPASLEKIGNESFSGCINLTEIELPENLKSIGERAFYGNSKISSIFIPQNVSFINDFAFENCISLEKIKVSEKNYSYQDIDGVLYTNDEAELIKYPPAKDEETFLIGNKVQIIHSKAFCSQRYLKEVIIGKNVNDIGDNAFSFCNILKEISVEKENKHFISLNGILYNASQSRLIVYPTKRGLPSYEIPQEVEIIEENALWIDGYITLFFNKSFVPEIKPQTWKNFLSIIVPYSSLEKYKENKAFDSSNCYIRSKIDYYEEVSKRKIKSDVKEFFTPYQGMVSLEIGGYYSYSKFNALNNIVFPADEDFKQLSPCFGIKGDLLFQSDDDSDNHYETCLFLDYSHVENQLLNDKLTYREFNLGGAPLGFNFLNRHFSMKTGIALSLLWETRKSEGYFDGTSFKIGFTLPCILQIRLTKFLSASCEYKWSYYPVQKLQKHSLNTGVLINTCFNN